MTKQQPPFGLEDAQQQSFDNIRNLYQQGSNEVPCSDIDKQILAAAERELSKPNSRKSYEIPWWRRLTLPLYAAAVFTFTAIGAHWFWPTPTMVPPGTAPAPVAIDVDVLNEESSLDQSPQRFSKKHRMPEQEALQAMPTRAKSVVEASEVNTPTGLAEQVAIEVDKPALLTITGSRIKSSNKSISKESSSTVPPEKEQWVREIIQLLKDGEHIAAQKELVAFKTVYPEYPIDEQLELFRN